MRILVCDGNQRSALAVVRSLGRAGYEVTAGDEVSRSLSSTSRYCKNSIAYPSPTRDPRGFQRVLIEVLQATSYDLLIPCTDKTCLLVLEIEDQVRKLVKVALPPNRIFLQAFNKHLIVETAQRLGMPVPNTHLINTWEDIEAATASMKYPAVLKVRQSHALGESGWSSGSVVYVNSAEDAKKKYQCYASDQPLLLQEKITGCGCGYFALLKDGKPIAEFAHERIREKPPTGGVSVLCKSVATDDQLRTMSLRLLQELKWDGVAMVEYKREAGSGEYKIMEVNGRFWGSLQLAIDAGVDFPRLMCDLYLSGDAERVTDFRAGVLGRWLLGDLDHLIAVLKRGLPGTTGIRNLLSKGGAILKFLVCFVRVTHGSVLRVGDIRPWFTELGQYFGWYFRKIGKRQ